ncbi:MAG: hypothetical protein JWQ49_4003, partial [Edaphobacter sp.]|nr:hypothetical protein [Edaphobacter sp.]
MFFPVTLLDNPPAEAAYVIRENFGPLRAVIKYQDLDEAVRLATWFEVSLAKLSRKSDTAAAIRYALSRWRALTRRRWPTRDRQQRRR